MAELEVLFLNLNFFKASLTSAGISTVAFDYLSAYCSEYGLAIVVLFLSDMIDCTSGLNDVTWSVHIQRYREKVVLSACACLEMNTP